MKPVGFEQATYVLGANNNPNTGDLSVCVAIDDDTPNVGFVVSCWEPSDEEIAQIVKDRKVYIGMMCNPKEPTGPPICVIGKSPFEIGFHVLVKGGHGHSPFKGKCDVNDLTFDIGDRKVSIEIVQNDISFAIVKIGYFDKDNDWFVIEPTDPDFLTAIQKLLDKYELY